MEVVLKANKLLKTFNKQIAVDKIDLELYQGEILGILGPDGAGKTTTIRLLVSALTPDQGDISLFGQQVKSENTANQLREKIGYVSQQFSLYPDLSVEENLDFFADIYGLDINLRDKKKNELYEFTQLAPYKTRRAENLSGGMKQKLALACALVHNPEILILDEPTTGVDPVSRREFWRILYNLIPQVSIIVTTPYMDEAERCSRLILMHDGKKIIAETPDKVKHLIKTPVYEITTEHTRQALQILLEKGTYKSIEMFGAKLHILLNQLDEKDDILKILKSNNILVEDARQVSPSLEDVFINLLKRKKSD